MSLLKRALTGSLIRSLAAGACGAFALAPGFAEAQEIGEPRTIERNTGPGASVRPGAYFPSRGDSGVAVDAHATYGIPVSPVVIAPGARFAGYFGERGAVSGMPIVEVKLPIGEIVPYAKAGAGIGHASGPNETSLAVMTGGGVDVHLRRDLLLGVEATWETVAGTDFNALAIGPRVAIHY